MIYLCVKEQKIRFLELNEFEVVEVKIVEVKFYDSIIDELLKFAVIISKSNGKWVFCKHKERDTYEVPGGHREEMRALTKQQDESYMKKQEQLNL